MGSSNKKITTSVYRSKHKSLNNNLFVTRSLLHTRAPSEIQLQWWVKKKIRSLDICIIYFSGIWILYESRDLQSAGRTGNSQHISRYAALIQCVQQEQKASHQAPMHKNWFLKNCDVLNTVWASRIMWAQLSQPLVRLGQHFIEAGNRLS